MVVVGIAAQRQKTEFRCLDALAKEIRGVEKDLETSLAERLGNDEHGIDMASQGSDRYENSAHRSRG